jgi:hypothetical protein
MHGTARIPKQSGCLVDRLPPVAAGWMAVESGGRETQCQANFGIQHSR